MNAAPCRTLLSLLKTLEIPHTFMEHEAVLTVAESRRVRGMLDGLLCKCLFCKSADDVFWLLVLQADSRLDMKKTAAALGCRRLSFAPAEELESVLGLSPGAVTPFGVINDPRSLVRVVIDNTLMESGQRLYFHPLLNTATVGLSPGGLSRFLEHTRHTPLVMPIPFC